MTLVAKKVIKDHSNVINAIQVGVKLMESRNTGGSGDRVHSSKNKSVCNILLKLSNDWCYIS